MINHTLDFEIEQKNYENELLLCQKAGGDIEEYRRLSFDVLQLEQIRRGLESGVDVSLYSDPDMSWVEMEAIRDSLEAGFDMKYYLGQGYDWTQCNEIRAGMQAKLDVSKYTDVHFLASQMMEIRLGLENGIDVSGYATPDFDWFQMKEIRLGLQKGIDVTKYAKQQYKHATMRAIRLGLQDNLDLTPYAEKGYAGKVLREIHRGFSLNNDVSGYLELGYNAEQLKQMNNAYEMGVNILPYLKKEFHGVQLQEIIAGLKGNIDVSVYAKRKYNWFQMRELRYGLESGVDVSIYANPDFSPKQMEVIRKGLMDGVNASEYAKVYYEPEEMEEIRERLEEMGTVLSEEMEELIRNTLVEDMHDDDAEVTDEEEKDFLLDACVKVSEDNMSAVLDFTSVVDMFGDDLAKMKVPDIMRLLKHQDVKQGIYRDRIKNMLDEKNFSEKIVVAEGKAAVDGDDGHFQYYFRKELNRKPKILKDGSVDYKNIELFESVEKDKLIAEYHSATQGVFGYDVKGQLISPKRGKELPPLKGTGFMISEDRKKYYSLLDGIIELEDERVLNIRNLFVVPGNVDASTGNINFNGDVNIMGNVESGFQVIASGNIVIDGHCESCRIMAGQDVVIRKGCQGQNTGEIVAGGSISGNFFESVKLRAKGDIIASYLLNTQLFTEGMLQVQGRKGVIIGGYACAKQGVSCYGISNIAEIRTILEVGIDKDDMAAYQELSKKIDKVIAELKTCETALNKFMEQPTRDEKTMALVDRLTKAVYTKKLEKKELLQEREMRMTQLTKQKGARIKVSGQVYPGTLLYMNAEPYVVRDVITNVEFVKKENAIDPILC